MDTLDEKHTHIDIHIYIYTYSLRYISHLNVEISQLIDAQMMLQMISQEKILGYRKSNIPAFSHISTIYQIYPQMTFPSFRDAGAVPGPGPVPEATCGNLAGLIPWDYHLVMTNIAGWIIPTRNGGFNLMGKYHLF